MKWRTDYVRVGLASLVDFVLVISNFKFVWLNTCINGYGIIWFLIGSGLSEEHRFRVTVFFNISFWLVTVPTTLGSSKIHHISGIYCIHITSFQNHNQCCVCSIVDVYIFVGVSITCFFTTVAFIYVNILITTTIDFFP
jgi:hypothetical protein